MRHILSFFAFTLTTSFATPSVDVVPDFTSYMFGELGVIEVRCDPDLVEVFTNQLGYILWCGETTDSFDIFQQKWDLYAEWEGKSPYIPVPETPWGYSFSAYSRSYSFLSRSDYGISLRERDTGERNSVNVKFRPPN